MPENPQQEDSDSKRQRRAGKSPVPEACSATSDSAVRTPSLNELRVIINRPQYCVLPCHPELADRFKGYCLDGVFINPDIHPSDYRVLADDVNSIQLDGLTQLDKVKDWLERHFDMLSNYLAKDLTGWHDLVNNLSGLNREHLKRIALLEEDKALLIRALKSRDKTIVELLGQESEVLPPSPCDGEKSLGKNA